MADLLEHRTNALRGISTVTGRYVIGDEPMHPGANVFACRLRSMTADRFSVTAPVIPQQGDKVLAKFGPFGALRGQVHGIREDGFMVDIDHHYTGRETLERSMTAFRDRVWSGTHDRRADHRFMPGNPRSVISRPDDWSHPCLVVDYSAADAAISAAFQPQVGEVVTIGQVTAEVVRLLDVGFAVRFFETQDLAELELLLEAPREWTLALRDARPGAISTDGEPDVLGTDG